MEPTQTQPAEVEEQISTQPHPVNQVTTVSKYLALALFILLPFVGGYIGYTYAPEKVVEVERVVYENASEQTGEIVRWDLFDTKLYARVITPEVVNQIYYDSLPGTTTPFMIIDDKLYVFMQAFMGIGHKVVEIEGISPTDFELIGNAPLGKYISDGRDLFFIPTVSIDYQSVEKIIPVKLDNFSPANFSEKTFIDNSGSKITFVTDGERLYFGRTLLEGLSLDSVSFNQYDLSLYDDDALWQVDYACQVTDYVPGERSTYDVENQNIGC